jgi:hypothetical protein
VSLARTRAGWSLSGLEGVPERLSSHLAMLAPPLQFHAAGLRAGSEGHYLVMVLARLEADMGDRPFSYRRALRLTPSLDACRPRPPMVAEPVGQAAIAGADVSPLTATLDTTIVEGAEAQLDASMSAMTSTGSSTSEPGFRRRPCR